MWLGAWPEPALRCPRRAPDAQFVELHSGGPCSGEGCPGGAGGEGRGRAPAVARLLHVGREPGLGRGCQVQGRVPGPPPRTLSPDAPRPPSVRFASAGLRAMFLLFKSGSLLIVHVSRLTPLPLSDASPSPGRTASLPAALVTPTLMAPQGPRPSLVLCGAQSCSSDWILAHSLPLSCLTWGSLCEPAGLVPTAEASRPDC